jgi:hypothetical protein
MERAFPTKRRPHSEILCNTDCNQQKYCVAVLVSAFTAGAHVVIRVRLVLLAVSMSATTKSARHASKLSETVGGRYS